MSHLFSEDFFSCLLIGLFLLFTVVQVLFGVSAWRAFRPLPSPAEPPANTYPAVSVIVCARNEAPQLRRNLPMLLHQQYPAAWELLVVDDASSDETAAVLADFERKHPQLRVIRIPVKHHAGKKQALAAGIAAARYEYLLLTDADAEPAGSSWLRSMTATALEQQQTEIVLGYGPLTTSATAGFFWSKWPRFEAAYTAMLYVTFARSGIPYMGVGRNLMIKKSLYERVGGFSKHLHLPSGDDDLLVNAAADRYNTAVCLAPESFVYSAGKTDYRGWWNQKKRHLGAGVAYRRSHQFLIGLLALSQTLHLFLFIALLTAGIFTSLVLILCVLRSLVLYFAYRRAFKSLGEYDLLSQIPINDALLAVYYGAFVPIILIGKKTHSWK